MAAPPPLGAHTATRAGVAVTHALIYMSALTEHSLLRDLP